MAIPAGYTLRAHRAADMPLIVERHAALYSKDYNFNAELAAREADKVAAAFLSSYDPKLDRCWVAEGPDGQFSGCVFLVKDRDTDNAPSSSSGNEHSKDKIAKLRLLLVEPSARGSGLGRALIGQCTQFAREGGYSRIRLWTNSGLTTARRLYHREGYRIVKEEEDETFGIKLTAEFWELAL
ncbi:acyl-CoA N-acyltransferase [Aspergillus heterothallicus]